jgi:hypothetical protein
MSEQLTLGSKFPYHEDWTDSDNCALCNRPVGSKATWVAINVNDELISRADFAARTEAACVPVGSTCANKIAKEVTA